MIKKTMTVLESLFTDRLVSKDRWPAKSPDLSPPDFFLWGSLKDTIEIQIKAIGECMCQKPVCVPGHTAEVKLL